MHQSTDKKKKYFLYFIIFLLLSTINNLSLIRSKELLSKIKTIEVIGLKNNITIKLPKEDTKYALIKAQNIIKSNVLNNNNIIDLRIANQVILLNE